MGHNADCSLRQDTLLSLGLPACNAVAGWLGAQGTAFTAPLGAILPHLSPPCSPALSAVAVLGI